MSYLVVVLLALVTALPGVVSTMQYDCSKGCSLVAGPIVCGEDGLTYQNECLALCQGVTVKSADSCKLQAQFLSRLAGFASTTDSAADVIPHTAINRYSEEGYRMAGWAQTGSFEPEAASIMDANMQSKAGSTSSTFMSIESMLPTHSATAAGVRQTRDGYIYYLQPSTAETSFMEVKKTFVETSGEGETVAGYIPQMSTNKAVGLLLQRMDAGKRRLFAATSNRADGSSRISAKSLRHLHPQTEREMMTSPDGRVAGSAGGRRALRHVIGRDDRTEITSSMGWPYSAVGQFVYKKGSCTGVMIGPRAVLTAGHCVYNRQKRIWQENIKFAPFRHRQGDKIVEPYGRIPYESVTTYSGWVDNSNSTDAVRYDVAVVRLSNDVIGYGVGWLGLTWDKRGFQGSIFSLGYPGDKQLGSLWMSTCNVTDTNGQDTRFVNSCDVSPGQSGSPMWEWRDKQQYLMRAVMTYQSCKCCNKNCTCCRKKFNGGCAINALHYNSILKWR